MVGRGKYSRRYLVLYLVGGIDFRRFLTPSIPIYGVVLGLLEATKMHIFVVLVS